jgi:hypothetical protein
MDSGSSFDWRKSAFMQPIFPSYAATPEDDWNFLIRAYRPDVDAFKDYQVPRVLPVN